MRINVVLPGAVRPEQRVKFSCADLELHIVECDLLTEPARQILDRNDGSARRAPAHGELSYTAPAPPERAGPGA